MRHILDLGMQKTGSKARQEFFRRELHRIRNHRAVYPAAGREGVWHLPLYLSLLNADRSALEAVASETRGRPDADLAILSYEELYRLEDAQIRWLKESLSDVVVVVFLRRQDQLVNSFHNQLHKAHRVPLSGLEAFEAHMLEYNPAYDHKATLARWTRVLGRGRVRPVVFTKSDSAVRAFARHAGLDVDFDGFVDEYPNRAMDAFGLAVLRWVKRLIRPDQSLVEAMNDAHRVLADHFVDPADNAERYTLSLEARRHILAIYHAGNEWVRQEFFPERKMLFDPLEESADLLHIDYSKGLELAQEILRDKGAR
jgi:hypothetical protein